MRLQFFGWPARLAAALLALCATASAMAQDISTITFNSAAYVGGSSLVHHGHVSLTSKAVDDTMVELDWSLADATGPDWVIVPAGFKSATFDFMTTNLNQVVESAEVQATVASTVSGFFTVNPMILKPLQLNTSKLYAGYTYQATISVNAPVFEDQVMLLSSDNSQVYGPGTSIEYGPNPVILAGTSSVTVPITVKPFPGDGDPPSYSFLDVQWFNTGQDVSRKNAIVQMKIVSFTTDLTTLSGGANTTGHVTLNFPPANDVNVKIVSSKAFVFVPNEITFPAGSTVGSFSIASGPVLSSKTAKVTVSIGVEFPYSKYVNLMITP